MDNIGAPILKRMRLSCTGYGNEMHYADIYYTSTQPSKRIRFNENSENDESEENSEDDESEENSENEESEDDESLEYSDDESLEYSDDESLEDLADDESLEDLADDESLEDSADDESRENSVEDNESIEICYDRILGNRFVDMFHKCAELLEYEDSDEWKNFIDPTLRKKDADEGIDELMEFEEYWNGSDVDLGNKEDDEEEELLRNLRDHVFCVDDKPTQNEDDLYDLREELLPEWFDHRLLYAWS
jgi:hypothetical protein